MDVTVNLSDHLRLFICESKLVVIYSIQGLKRFCDVIDETKFSEEAVRKFVEINEEAIEQVRFTNREIIYQKGSVDSV